MSGKRRGTRNKPEKKAERKGQATPKLPISQAENSAGDVTTRSKAKGEE